MNCVTMNCVTNREADEVQGQALVERTKEAELKYDATMKRAVSRAARTR